VPLPSSGLHATQKKRHNSRLSLSGSKEILCHCTESGRRFDHRLQRVDRLALRCKHCCIKVYRRQIFYFPQGNEQLEVIQPRSRKVASIQAKNADRFPTKCCDTLGRGSSKFDMVTRIERSTGVYNFRDFLPTIVSASATLSWVSNWK